MSGLDLCQFVRNNNPIACIFALTGYAHLFDLLRCRQAGLDDYFAKPVPLNVLLKTVKNGFERLGRWKCEDYELMGSPLARPGRPGVSPQSSTGAAVRLCRGDHPCSHATMSRRHDKRLATAG